jgi:HAD superfamily hydrolase (TIGR01509 family)
VIRTMFFDAGETLVHMPPWHGRLVNALAGLGLHAEDARIDDALKAGERWLAARPHQDLLPNFEAEERHTMGHLEVIARALAIPGLDVHYLRDTCYYVAAAQVFPDAAPTLSQVRAMGFRTAVISNAPPSLRALLVRTGLSPLVDTVALSSDIGVMKPGEAIFRTALERAGVAPGEAAFADDVPANVDAARALGFAQAWVIDRDGQVPDREDRLADLSGLPRALAALQSAAQTPGGR